MVGDDVKRETHSRAAALSEKEVLDELKRNGVNNLQDLVRVRLETLRQMNSGVAEERGSILIYKCFVLADWGA